jgi:hypothetical protein
VYGKKNKVIFLRGSLGLSGVPRPIHRGDGVPGLGGPYGGHGDGVAGHPGQKILS